jgi:hypothetical protein
VVALELLRAASLLSTPYLIGFAWWLIVPILFFLSSINAVVQPARQAAIPTLVPVGQVGKANAIVAATTMLAGAIGFGVAGGILGLYPNSTNVLFIADAATFVLAAVIVLSIPTLGGGSIKTSLLGAFQRSWAIRAIRPHLALGTLASFILPISYPAVLALAYQVSTQHGAQAFSVFELLSSAGIFVGSILVSRVASIGSMRTVGMGLMLTGVFSLAIAFSPLLALIGAALFVASVGNPIYAVANQTALVEAADPSNRGSVMATRFGLVQTASIVGIAVGGLITKQYGPLMAYGVLGIGLILLAMYAIAAGRSTTNPLHGERYEEAMLGRAKS